MDAGFAGVYIKIIAPGYIKGPMKLSIACSVSRLLLVLA
jgi:hypothetical protein